jgi:hypothetical protein
VRPRADERLAACDEQGEAGDGAGGVSHRRGKAGFSSLCYQLPALMLEGLTLVISPRPGQEDVIALMKDQVEALRGAGRGGGAAGFLAGGGGGGRDP